jgi:AcrR family transcriptional regulator
MEELDSSAQSQAADGLRERKKRRTHRTIVRTALRLFTKHGFDGATLVQIANAAEVAPSTLHAYFRTKEDIVFELHDATRASMRTRIAERAEAETVIDAMTDWISQTLPGFAAAESLKTLRQRRAIIESDNALLAGERLRFALLEDDLALAFAEDVGDSPDDLRVRLLASLAANGLVTVWSWWFKQQNGKQVDAGELAELDVGYLMRLISAAEEIVKTIPQRPGVSRT